MTPDLALPFGLTLPGVDQVAALTVLLGAVLGALVADVLLTLRPFARHRTTRLTATLVALVAASMAFGAFADRSWGSLAVAAVIGVTAAIAYGWLFRGANLESGATGPLSDDELRRGKAGSDRWVLVAGSVASGKTTLVGGMIDEARPRMAGPARSAEDAGVRVTELVLRNRRDDLWRLRFWEARSIEENGRRLPPLSDFDAIVLVVDPTQHTTIAGSFPGALRAGRESADANDDVLRLAEALEGGCTVWAVATKADLLRLSVHPPLVDSLPVGPGWHERLRDMDVSERRPLTEALGLRQFLVGHQPAFAWGAGSPLFAFAGDARGDPFGAPHLFDALLEAL